MAGAGEAGRWESRGAPRRGEVDRHYAGQGKRLEASTASTEETGDLDRRERGEAAQEVGARGLGMGGPDTSYYAYGVQGTNSLGPRAI